MNIVTNEPKLLNNKRPPLKERVSLEKQRSKWKQDPFNENQSEHHLAAEFDEITRLSAQIEVLIKGSNAFFGLMFQ